MSFMPETRPPYYWTHGEGNCAHGKTHYVEYACPYDPCEGNSMEIQYSEDYGDCFQSNGCVVQPVDMQACVDLYGYPPGTDPATCSDYEKTEGEDGIDCGGACSTACKTYCPQGTKLFTDHCYHETAPDKFGNCPDGYGRAIVDGVVTMCSKNVGAAVVANPSYVEDHPEVTDEYVGGSFSVGHFETGTTTSTTITDNGDGTSTVVKDKTTTNPDGSTSHSKTTSRVDNATGNVINSHGTTDGTKPVEDNPDNYSFGNGLDKVDNAIDGDGEIASKFSIRFSEFTSAFTQSDIVIFMNSVFDFSGHDGSAVSTIDMGEWGTAQLDYSPYEGVLNTFGYLLIMCSFFVAYRLIIANK